MRRLLGLLTWSTKGIHGRATRSRCSLLPSTGIQSGGSSACVVGRGTEQGWSTACFVRTRYHFLHLNGRSVLLQRCLTSHRYPPILHIVLVRREIWRHQSSRILISNRHLANEAWLNVGSWAVVSSRNRHERVRHRCLGRRESGWHYRKMMLVILLSTRVVLIVGWKVCLAVVGHDIYDRITIWLG